MKKILLISAISLCLLGILISCEKESCKECRVVTYENGSKISEGSPDRYCGDQLSSVEGQTATVGNRTTVIVCN